MRKASANIDRRRRAWGTIVAILQVLFPLVAFHAGFTAAPARASVATLRQKLRTQPDNLRLRYLLARAYSKTGDHDKAVRLYKQILTHREIPKVMFHLGLEFAKMGNLSGAVHQWNRVVRQKPNNIQTLGYLALALHKQALTMSGGQRQQDLLNSSLRHWKRILRIDPGSSKARYYAGIAHYKLGEYSRACKHWIILLRQRRDHTKTLFWLAKGLIRLGQKESVSRKKSRFFEKAEGVLAKLKRIEMPKSTSRLFPKVTALLERLQSGELKELAPPVQPSEFGSDGVTRDPPAGPDDDPTKIGTGKREIKIRWKPLPPPPNAGSDIDIEAETHFLDGLDYKEKGQYEKALFSFLQAIDKDPKFAQVYLQVGDVYMKLAKLAPTRTQYDERITLAIQSLEKAIALAPSSLLGHAAQSKIVIIKKLRGQGFAVHHLNVARKGVKDKREEDAFEEYVLLLSNLIFRHEVFFELAGIVPALSDGNKQDLQYFCEELVKQHKGNPFVYYLTGKAYLGVGKPQLAKDYLERFLRTFPKELKKLTAYKNHVGSPLASREDLYLLARLLYRRDARGHRRQVVSLLKAFRKKLPSGHMFRTEATELWNAVYISPQANVPSGNVWKRERATVESKIPRVKVLFEGFARPSHLDGKLASELTIFCEGNPDNGLARFLLAWTLAAQADRGAAKAADLSKRATALFDALRTAKTNDPLWHFLMGSQALRWDLDEEGKKHLEMTGHVLLSLGSEGNAYFAGRAIFEARNNIEFKRPKAAATLLEVAKIYDRTSLNYHLARVDLKFSQGRYADGLGGLIDWAGAALDDPWIRRIVLCDLSLLAWMSLLFTLFATAIALVVRYFEHLHHFFVEYWSSKGILLPLSLCLPVAGIVLFPSGLAIFLPMILWPMMTRPERIMYGGLFGAVLLCPLFLPLSVSENYELIRQAENLQRGNVRDAHSFFLELGKKRPADFNVQYTVGLLSLKLGKLREAETNFERLKSRDPRNDRVEVNLGIIQAKRGNYDGKGGAISHFQRALSLNAKSIPALLNLSLIYGHRKKKDKADQYYRYADSLAAGRLPLHRYRDVPDHVAPLVLMEAGLPPDAFATRFSLLSTDNFLQLNQEFVGFGTVMLLGFGLVGFLLFLWGKMDITLLRCSRCRVVMCTLCQKMVNNAPHCPACHNDPSAHKPSQALLEGKEFTFKKALGTNLIFPGTGFLFSHHVILASVLQPLFWFLVLVTYTRGGSLINQVFVVLELGPRQTILWMTTGLALFLYLCAQVFTYRLRGDVVEP